MWCLPELDLRRTPVAVPSADRVRVHSRTKASVAVCWPSGEPIDRSPADERSTECGGGVVGTHDAGTGMHRPAVPERVRADAAKRRGHGVLLPQDTRQSGTVVSVDGAHDAALCQRSGALRTARGRRSDPFRTRRAQGCAHTGVSAALARRRRRAVHRQGTGAGARGTHRTTPRSGGRRQLSMVGVEHGDGQPLLRVPDRTRTSARCSSSSARTFPTTPSCV